MIKLPFDLKLNKDNPQMIVFAALASVLVIVVYFYFIFPRS